jgi:SAM domain (Sterile alpha motif)
MEIADWLRQLDLEQYIATFAENAIDWSVLPILTADALKELGVVAIGHRRKLLNAIATLSARSTLQPPTSDAETVAIDRHVLRPGRLDGALGAPRSRGFARSHRRLWSRAHPVPSLLSGTF